MTNDRADEAGRSQRPRRRHRGLWIALSTVVGILLVIGIVTSITPWPSALLIRALFERGPPTPWPR